MAGKSLNRVQLIGNLGKDPEVKFTPQGTPVAKITIATNERFKDKSGEWQDRTEWHNLVAFGKVAEIIRDYVKKGAKLYVEGSLRTSSWDDKTSGQKKYKTEIIVNDISLLSGRGEGEGGGSYTRQGSGSSSSSGDKSGGYAQPAPDYGDTGITDDDIPF
jgi:single-strand DNA-binding protein